MTAQQPPKMPIRLTLGREAANLLATTMRSHGYDAERLSRLMGIGVGAPQEVRNAALAHLCGSFGPLGTLAQLFGLGIAVPLHAAAEALAPCDPGAMTAAGILEIDDGHVMATIQIQTFGPYLIACDRMEWCSHPEFVLQLTESARLLASAAWFPAAGRVLDLGCGAGLLAVIASDLGADVVATDNNPRAAMFTTLNAGLNDVKIETRVGEMFDTVFGEQFDLIVANLPFIITPDGKRPAISSPLLLDEFSRTFALCAPGYLAAGGSCQFLAGWPRVDGAEPDERVLSWFQDFQGDVWVMVFQESEIADYSAMYVDSQPVSTTSYAKWIGHFADLNVSGVIHGLVTMARSSATAFQVVTHDLGTYDSPFSDHLLEVFEARRKVNTEGPETLAAAVLQVGHGTHFVAEHAAGSQGFETIRVEKRVGVHGVFSSDPIVYAFLTACDGTRRLREAASVAAAANGQELTHQLLNAMVNVAAESLYSGILRFHVPVT